MYNNSNSHSNIRSSSSCHISQANRQEEAQGQFESRNASRHEMTFYGFHKTALNTLPLWRSLAFSFLLSPYLSALNAFGLFLSGQLFCGIIIRSIG